jgi:hypothetical protein
MTVITPSDIIASANVNGAENVLEVNYDLMKKIKDNKAKNEKKNTQTNTHYIKIVFVNEKSEKLSYPELKVDKIITKSVPKVPGGGEVQVSTTKMSIAFEKLSREQIDNMFTPKVKEDPREQEKENKRIKKLNDIYEKKTNEFIEAIDILDKSYLKCFEDIKRNKTKLGISIKKNTVALRLIQSTRKPSDEELKENEHLDEVKLENPIYRVKICLERESTKRVGYYGFDNKDKKRKFYPSVYDIRKTLSNKKKLQKKTGKAANVEPVLAKVKNQDGIFEDLTAYNVHQFLKYMSIVSGTISMEFCLHAFGFSFTFDFKDLYVITNKREKANPVKAFMEDNDFDDVSSDSDNETQKKPTTKSDSTDESNYEIKSDEGDNEVEADLTYEDVEEDENTETDSE